MTNSAFRAVRRCIVLSLLALIIGQASAQASTLLVLTTATTELQTGQFYEIEIGIREVQALWLADVDISYDPTMLYIAGTMSGQPVQLGTFFAPPNLTAVVRNTVDKDHVLYTASLLNPADPVSGSGVLGTLRIYPLQAGKTQIMFARGQLTTLSFTTGADGQKVPGEPELLPFTPALVELNITGDTVQPPPEVTATPLPTETAAPLMQTLVASETPLVNITLAPDAAATPVPLALQDVPAPGDDRNAGAMVVAGAVLMVVAVGLLVVLFRRRR